MKRVKVSLPTMIAAVVIPAFSMVLLLAEPAGSPQGPAAASLQDEGGAFEPSEEMPSIASPDEQAVREPVGEPDNELFERVRFLLDRIVDSASSSSNPHNDFIGSADFEELVSMGRPALYTMFEMYAKSHEDGLKEYVMATACAKILGVYDDERGIGIDSGVDWFMKYGSFGLDELHFVDADYHEFLNTGTIKEGISLPDRTDRTDLDEVISDYVLARQRRSYYMGEKALEAHHIYRTEKIDDMVHVYMLVRFGWFEFQDGVFTCISGSGGIPTKMVLKKDKDNQYEVISYKEPMDGSLWLSSLQELFPDDLVEIVMQKDERAELDKQQVEILQEKAADYLKSIGRENAPVEYRYRPELADEGIRMALYLINGMRREFPDWVGSREALIYTGGPYPGMTVRCIMETSVAEDREGEYIVTLKRIWNTEINGKQPISMWKYRVSGNSVTLIEEQNMDDLVYLVK